MIENKTLVKTSFGDKIPDNTGSLVAAVRMDPGQAYRPELNLLREYLDQGSQSAWIALKSQVDNVYLAVRTLLDTLEAETGFIRDVRIQLKSGKKLFFKPNLVAMPTLDPLTHESRLNGCCVPWEFLAAVMRWFHQKQGISYYQMAAGEAGNTTPVAVQEAIQAWGQRVTTQSLMEGRTGDKYGGWGFYFIRRYLLERRLNQDSEDPLQGYQDSLESHCHPMGKVSDKLLFYDLNDIGKEGQYGREIALPEGVNFKQVIIHKAIVGGDPQNQEDHQNWPGCVLVNVAKLKIHLAELITGCVKNLGIGLYPINALIENGASCDWVYGLPKLKTPCFKMVVPHQRWEPQYDSETLSPLLDSSGQPIYRRTGGLEASIGDMLQALQQASVSAIHIIDGIQCTNINHAWPEAVSLPEGLVLAGLDPVAVDTLGARYLFTMVPLAEAAKIQKESGLKSDVIQKTPLPVIEGQNIITQEGYDSAFSRYHGFQHFEERGLGQRLFRVKGVDLWKGGQMASINQHLGQIENGVFNEILTSNLYHTPLKYYIDLQAMSFSYLEANDTLSGSHYHEQLLEALDENRDGTIDYLETGKGLSIASMSYAQGSLFEGLERARLLKLHFLLSMNATRLMCKEWNLKGLEINSHEFITQGIGLAYQMSRDKQVHEHPLSPGRSYGGGNWPSLQYMIHKLEFARVYGYFYPDRIDLLASPFGMAFQYADLTFNQSRYVTSQDLAVNGDAFGRYKKAFKEGAPRLPFTVYVPTGMGRDWFGFLLNVEETTEVRKMFSASFENGASWDQLHLSEFGLNSGK